MKRTILASLAFLFFLGAAVAQAKPPVGISKDFKAISERAQKGEITKYLNKLEGRKATFAQRNGKLGQFETLGGPNRLWTVTGPQGQTVVGAPFSRSFAGRINVDVRAKGPRVMHFPTAVATTAASQ